MAKSEEAENMTTQAIPTPPRRAVLDVGGLHWATSAAGIALGPARCPQLP
jgi:hypothetical protein